MPWHELLTQGRVARELTSKKELPDLKTHANQYLAAAKPAK